MDSKSTYFSWSKNDHCSWSSCIPGLKLIIRLNIVFFLYRALNWRAVDGRCFVFFCSKAFSLFRFATKWLMDLMKNLMATLNHNVGQTLGPLFWTHFMFCKVTLSIIYNICVDHCSICSTICYLEDFMDRGTELVAA